VIIIVDTIDKDAVSAAEKVAEAGKCPLVKLTYDEYEKFKDLNYVRILNEGREERK